MSLRMNLRTVILFILWTENFMECAAYDCNAKIDENCNSFWNSTFHNIEALQQAMICIHYDLNVGPHESKSITKPFEIKIAFNQLTVKNMNEAVQVGFFLYVYFDNM